jgi:phage shock protein C
MKRGELFRNKRNGKIGGVCAGVADYFGMEAWLVRILTITAFLLLAGPFVLVGYIALWLILEDKSGAKSHTSSHKGFANAQQSSNTSTYDGKGFKNSPFNDHHKVEVKSKVWQSGVPPRQAFIDIKQQYENVENKLRRLESYVTSKEFEINREINRL